VLRGSAPAKIDEKGRLKIPNAFRGVIQETHGAGLFVTSLEGESVLIYPMPVWLEIERRLASMPTTHPARKKYVARTSYFGQRADIDPQGRVLIHPRLRTSAQMAGVVDVLGQQEFLEVWNHDRLATRIVRESFTDEDAKALADYGI
jgi:MraZ protein